MVIKLSNQLFGGLQIQTPRDLDQDSSRLLQTLAVVDLVPGRRRRKPLTYTILNKMLALRQIPALLSSRTICRGLSASAVRFPAPMAATRSRGALFCSASAGKNNGTRVLICAASFHRTRPDKIMTPVVWCCVRRHCEVVRCHQGIRCAFQQSYLPLTVSRRALTLPDVDQQNESRGGHPLTTTLPSRRIHRT